MNVNEISSDFQFVGSRVCELSVKNDFVFFPENSSLSKNIDVSYEIVDISTDDTSVLGILNLYVTCKISEVETDKVDTNNCNIYLALNGCFISGTKTDSNIFKQMLSVNGCAALYSIARSFIMSLSAQISINCNIVLPMINTFRLVEKSEEN